MPPRNRLLFDAGIERFTESGSVDAPKAVKTVRDPAHDAFTFIHGSWYDLSQFSHPGGPVALSLAHGRDATVLFEQSHVFTDRSRLSALLGPLRVGPELSAALHARFPRVAGEAACYNFDAAAATLRVARGCDAEGAAAAAGAPAPPTDAFEADVLFAARRYFAAEAARRGVSMRAATKAPPARWAHFFALLALFVLSVPPLVRGWWPALVITPTLCWVWMVNYWHDAAHFAMSASWRANALLTYAAPWFSSPLMWYHQHVIGHHAYTNMPGRDPDLYHAPSVWRFSADVRARPVHAWQAVTTPILWLLSVPTLLMLKPLVALRRGVYNRVVVLRALPRWRVAAHLAGRAGVFASLYVWPFFAFPGRYAKATAFALVPIAVYSAWFMVSSQPNHHSEDCRGDGAAGGGAAGGGAAGGNAAGGGDMTGGDGDAAPAGHRRVNFYRHQCATSQTVAPGSEIAFWLSGGLNLQCEHHLLPTVNHWHLRALQPEIEALARRHGVPYPRSATIAEAFEKLWRFLRIMGRDGAAAEAKKAA
jgi:delta11-fatty-acid desaturase